MTTREQRQRAQRPLGPLDVRWPTRAKHGMSRVELDVMLQAQRGRCVLCGTLITGPGEANVDHSHALAALHPHPIGVGCRLCVRGLVCRACNLMLGNAKDSPAVLRRAADYLDRFEGKGDGQ